MDHQQPVQQPLQQQQYYPIPETQREKIEQLQYQQAAFDPYYVQPTLAGPDLNAGNGPPTGSGHTVLSVTRGVALSVLAAIVLLLLLVIGLSAGLGVSQRDLNQVKGDLAVVQAALSSAVAVG
jgi:hypothetical protein